MVDHMPMGKWHHRKQASGLAFVKINNAASLAKLRAVCNYALGQAFAEIAKQA